MADQLGLVIEDDPGLSEIFAYALQFVKVRPRRFTSGDEALAWLSDESEEVPAVVLLDLQMPGVSGDVILRYIRKTKRLEHVKVMVISAHARMAESMREEADVVLVKPVRLDELQTMVTRLVSQSKTASEKGASATQALKAKKAKPDVKSALKPSREDAALARKKVESEAGTKSAQAKPAQQASTVESKKKPDKPDSSKPVKSDLLKGKTKSRKSSTGSSKPVQSEQK